MENFIWEFNCLWIRKKQIKPLILNEQKKYLKFFLKFLSFPNKSNKTFSRYKAHTSSQNARKSHSDANFLKSFLKKEKEKYSNG